MANLEFYDKHNMVAYLEKSEGSEGFHEIIDFLCASHIHYALTASPAIYTSLIEQFWKIAALCTIDDEVLGITATIDRKVKITVLEGSIRRHLKLEDSEGIPSLPWKLFIHTILHCLSPKKTAWEQFSSNIATAIICLATNRTFNFSKFIFDAMTKKTYSTALTRLILRVKKLEKNVKTGKAKIRAKIVISEDENAAEDSSKQGRKISDIDTDPIISLVQPKQDMEYDFDATASIPVTTAGLEISTANLAVSTADAAVTIASASISTISPPRVSIAEDISGAETLVYIRRNASKAKDKGKSIM
ncbi:hypothetical protein Tco_0665376 [Tanacetum coccineum]